MKRAYSLALGLALAVGLVIAWLLYRQSQERLPVLIEFAPRPGGLAPLGRPVISMLPDFFSDDALRIDETYDVRVALPPAPLGGPQRPMTYLARATIRRSDLQQFVARASAELVGVHADPVIRFHGAQAGTACKPYVGTLAEMNTALGAPALSSAGMDGSGVLLVIVDTEFSVESVQRHHQDVKFEETLGWAESGTADGKVAPSDTHGTMTAYAATILAPKATLVEISSSPFTPSRLHAVHTGLTELRKNLPGPLDGYNGIVVNNSWGVDLEDDFDPGDAAAQCAKHGEPKDKIHGTSSPCHILNVLFKDLDALNVDVVFSAGNCGQCAQQTGGAAGTIWGPNSLAEVLTVGSVDVKGRRVFDSSQGPGIPGLGEQKPDILTFSEFSKGPLSLAPGELAPVFADPGGTSGAGALTAGVIAALRSKLPRGCFSGAEMRHLLRTRARPDLELADGRAVRVGGGTTADPDAGWGVLSVTELLAKPLPHCKVPS